MALVPYSTFTVDDIMAICGVTPKMALVVHHKINGRSYDLSTAIEDWRRVEEDAAVLDADTPEYEKMGTTLAEDISIQGAIERERIAEQVKECHRKLKTWRRKERRERTKE